MCVCMHMCVCMYRESCDVQPYKCHDYFYRRFTKVHTYVHTYVCTYVHMYVCAYVRMYVYVFIERILTMCSICDCDAKPFIHWSC